MSFKPAGASMEMPVPDRLAYIDMLRGAACLWVTYCHAHAEWCDLAPGQGIARLLTTFVGIGGKGVDLFVVLSGFCLFYPVARRRRNGRPQRPTAQFYRRRAFRILPVYLAAIAVSLALIRCGFNVAQYRGLPDLVPYFLLVQNSMPEYIARVNGPLWSVALESQFYIAFPLLVFAWQRIGGIGVVLIAATMSVAAGILHASGFGIGAGFDVTASYTFPVRLVQFTMGMLVGAHVASPERLRPIPWLAAAALALPLALWTVSRTGADSPLRFAQSLAWGVVGAGLIAGCRLAAGRSTRFTRLGYPLEKLGLISFSFYAIHFPIMFAMEPYFRSSIRGPIQGLALFTVTTLPVLLIASVVLFWTVERHFISTSVRESPPPTADTEMLAVKTLPSIVTTATHE